MARKKPKAHLIIPQGHKFRTSRQAAQLSFNSDWCKGCSICVQFCPKGVLELNPLEKVVAVRPEECICCRLCEMRCPDLAIEIAIEDEDNE